MSGGHFDYKEHAIKDIAQDIQDYLIEYNRPRPKKVMKHYVSIAKKIGDGTYVYPSDLNNPYWNPYSHETSISSREQAISILRHTQYITEDDNGRFFDTNDTYKSSNGNILPCEYIINESDSLVYEDGNYYDEFSKETIEIMETAIKKLNEAYAYAHAIDYLLSGDSSEDSLKQDIEYYINQEY